MASQELSSLVITVIKNKRNTTRSQFHEYSVSMGEHFISTENEYIGGDHNSFFCCVDLIFLSIEKSAQIKISSF